MDEDRLSLLLWNTNRLYCKVRHRFSWEASDPLPAKGPAILVCNHRSSVDPFILAAATRRVISYLVAQEVLPDPRLSLVPRLDAMRPGPKRPEGCGGRPEIAGRAEKREAPVRLPGGGDRAADSTTRTWAWGTCPSVRGSRDPAYVSGTPASDSVWKAMFMPSRSRVSFGAVCRPPPGDPGGSTREQLIEWTHHLMRAVTDLELLHLTRFSFSDIFRVYPFVLFQHEI